MSPKRFYCSLEDKFKVFFMYLAIDAELVLSQVPASNRDSSRFGVWHILQVNERQMCGDSTTLISPNQCHTVTTWGFSRHSVLTPFSQDQTPPEWTHLKLLKLLFELKPQANANA